LAGSGDKLATSMTSPTAKQPAGAVTPEGIAEDSSLLRNSAIVGAMALSSIVALDLMSSALWEKGSTKITTSFSGPKTGREPRWLALPGLGQQDGEFIAANLREVLPGVVDWASYSSRGITRKTIGQTLGRYFHQHYDCTASPAPKQNVLLHSMGLPTYLKGVEWCLQNGIVVPPIGVMMAFSSPMNASDTFMPNQIRLAARSPYPGGVFSKMGVEFYQRHLSEHFRFSSIGKSLLGAFKSSYQDCPPALWSSQVRLLASADNYPTGIFNGVITPATRVILFGDEKDESVNMFAARKDLSDFVIAHGATMIVVDTPGEGHANLPGARKYIPQLLAEAA
jgi:hypothetical protein